MKYEGVRFISNGAIKKAVVSKEADFSSRRNTFVDVVDVDKEEEGTQDSALEDSREDRGRKVTELVRKVTDSVDKLCFTTTALAKTVLGIKRGCHCR